MYQTANEEKIVLDNATCSAVVLAAVHGRAPLQARLAPTPYKNSALRWI
jgi:hypothetical protein